MPKASTKTQRSRTTRKPIGVADRTMWFIDSLVDGLCAKCCKDNYYKQSGRSKRFTQREEVYRAVARLGIEIFDLEIALEVCDSELSEDESVPDGLLPASVFIYWKKGNNPRQLLWDGHLKY